MNMKNFRFSALFILAALLSGCVETIVMDPHEKDLPVSIHCALGNSIVDGAFPGAVFLTGKKQSMTIKYVKGKSEDEYIPVTDAKVLVEVSDTLGRVIDNIRFVHTGNGTWESETEVLILDYTHYSLSVDIPGKETIWAETLSPSSYISTFYLPEDIRKSDKYRGKEEEIVMRYPFMFRERVDCPLWIFAQGYTPEGWKDLKYLVTDNPYADDMNVTGRTFSELEISGTQDMDDISDKRLRYVFETSRGLMPDLSLHEGYVRISEIESDMPFFLHAGPIWYLNLRANDYYGIFDDGIPKMIEGFYSDGGHTWSLFYRYVFHFVNSDLDEYLRSVYNKEHQSRNYLTSLYSTTNTFTNIHGGVGIFGCDNIRNIVFLDPIIFYLVNGS